jgi:ATP-binding cassette subfamily C protein CydD
MTDLLLTAKHRAERPLRRATAKWLTGRAPVGRRRLVLALHLLESLSLITLLVGLGHVLATLLTEGAGPALLPWLAALAGLALLRTGLRALAETYATGLALAVVHDIRHEASARALDPGWRLRHPRQPGELATRLGEQADALAPWYHEYLPARALTAVQPAIILALALHLDWLAALLLLAAAPLIPLFSALIGMGTASLAEQQQQRLVRMGGHFLDRIRALPTLRLFRVAAAEGAEVSRAAERYRESSMRVLRVAFLSSAVLEFFAAVAIATIAIYIGMALLGYIQFGPAAQLDFRAGLTVLLLAPEFFQPLRRLAAGYHERAAALAAAPELRQMLESPLEPPGMLPAGPWRRPPAIRCDHLRLTWPGASRTLIDGLQLDVPPGEWLAIRGASGAGKSTLAAALLGLLAPRGGLITVDGRLLSAIAPGELRANLGWLGQQPHLLPASLRRNLDPGGRQGSESLTAALEEVGLGRLLDLLPAGLDSPLGERGAGISGGEAQRLALARTLLPRPRLLVLDEPTASLDPDSARIVLDCLRRQAGGATVIMFSHSQAAVGAADRTLRLVGGRLHAD